MLNYFFPDVNSFSKQSEVVFVFESDGGRALSFSSNCYYEIILDGEFFGVGGQRCVEGTAYIDSWPQVEHAKKVAIRVHWLNPLLSRVFYRSVFTTSFVSDINSKFSWVCYEERGLRFAHKMSTQLASQNIFTKMSKEEHEPLPLIPINAHNWALVPLPIKPLSLISCVPSFQKRENVKVEKKTDFASHSVDLCNCEDLVPFVFTKAKRLSLVCDTYDLGTIGLYNIKLSLHDSIGWVVACYGEIASFSQTWTSPNRHKVHMADALYERLSARVINERGCRYVHLIYPRNQKPPSICAWRLEYPFTWKKDLLIEPSSRESLLSACKANLVACCDGGLVDTCWRERVQWTGDLRMSAKAIRSLTENPEVVSFVLEQIADSYDKKTGMCQGSWPTVNPDYRLQMPTYHLAFCLAACEHDSTIKFSLPARERSKVATVVIQSIKFWKKRYLVDGFLRDLPGWSFVDWDFKCTHTMGKGVDKAPNSVIMSWWIELCRLVDATDEINKPLFEKTFWTGEGYKLVPHETGANLHATAAILSSNACGEVKNRTAAFTWLRSAIKNQKVQGRVTPYFAYFFAHALQHESDKEAQQFIDLFYSPIVKCFGTIYEKHNDAASLAHGWSIGIAEIAFKSK